MLAAVALDGIRKVVTIVEDVTRESGEPVEPPTRLVAAGAVVENPFAGRYVADLQPLVDRYCEPLGELLIARALEVLGTVAEGVGKGALVGLDGDVEHGSAIIHNLRFGNKVRDAIAGDRLAARGREARRGGHAARHRGQAQGRPHGALPPPDVRGPCAGRAPRRRDRDLGRARLGRTAARAPRRVRQRAAGRRLSAVASIAFIGLGTMGAPMAGTWLPPGTTWSACDLDPTG